MITYRHVHCIAGVAHLMPWGTKKENTVFPAILSHRRGEILFVDGFPTNILAAVVQTNSLNRKSKPYVALGTKLRQVCFDNQKIRQILVIS